MLKSNDIYDLPYNEREQLTSDLRSMKILINSERYHDHEKALRVNAVMVELERLYKDGLIWGWDVALDDPATEPNENDEAVRHLLNEDHI